MQKLYLKSLIDKKRPKTVSDLLQYYFFSTLDNGAIVAKVSEATYHDKECKLIQCFSSKMRSFDDIYFLCKTYFHTVTPKKVMHELLTIKPMYNNCKDLIFYPYFSYCNTMSRIRITFNNAHNIYNYKKNRIINNNIFQIPKLNSLYSWEQLLAMLDIKNLEELNKYIEKHEKFIHGKKTEQNV